MSAEPLDWYKREQRRFLNATAGWSLENKGAYSVLIDLMMDQPRGLIDNDQWIAGQLGTSVRKWRIIKSFLISQDKIFINGGIISNKKADKVKMIQRLFQDKQAENRRNPNKNKTDEPTVVASREDKKTTTNVVNTDTIVSVSDKPKSTRGTRISEDWQPSQDDFNQALQMGLTVEQIDHEANKFRDYWIGVPGSKGVKLNWSATWRNQCRHVIERRGGKTSRPNPVRDDGKPQTFLGETLRLIKEREGYGNGG